MPAQQPIISRSENSCDQTQLPAIKKSFFHLFSGAADFFSLVFLAGFFFSLLLSLLVIFWSFWDLSGILPGPPQDLVTCQLTCIKAASGWSQRTLGSVHSPSCPQFFPGKSLAPPSAPPSTTRRLSFLPRRCLDFVILIKASYNQPQNGGKVI